MPIASCAGPGSSCLLKESAVHKVRKRLPGILVGLIIVAAAVLGILGWKNQFLRLPIAKTPLTQATAASVEDLPILSRPLMR